MSRNKSSFWTSITGEALPATMYMLVYTAYTLAFTNDMNVNLIRLLYAIYYALTFFYAVKCFLLHGSSRFLKYYSLLSVLIILYGVVLLIIGTSGWKRQIDPSSFLLYYLPSILPVFAFYYFGRRGIVTERWFKVFFALFFLNVVMSYFKEQRTLLMQSMTNQDDFITNTGYMVASLLPLICFFDKRKIIQYVFAATIIVFSMMCYKRGAILCAGLSLAYFMFKSMKTAKSSGKIVIIVFIFAFVFFISNYIENLMSSNEFFYYRVMESMEGNTSGREDIYEFFLSYFFSAENGLNILWGNGAEGTVKIFGQAAHNDWLEMAIDFGILGLIIYFLYWIFVYKNISFAKKQISSAFYVAIVMCVIFNFSRSFISMSIGNMSFISASILGCGMGMIDAKKINKLYH